MNIWVILLAAGQGRRLAGHGASVPKQFIPFAGEPLFRRSAVTFSRLAAVRGIVFVFPPGLCPVSDVADISDGPEAALGSNDPIYAPDDPAHSFDPAHAAARYDAWLGQLDRAAPLGLPWAVTFGGERRQDSVRHGLAALPPECDAVLVHDSARPFVSPALTERVIAGLRAGHAAAIPGIAVNDTIKEVDAAGCVIATPPRHALRAVQTPQGFALGPLRAAHERAEAEGWNVTDDAALMELCGRSVMVVEGDEANCKITTLRDLVLLGPNEDTAMPALIPCTGFGYDVHRYDGDRPFILGGVPIASDIRVKAHSDGDTLLHALMDAMLGCIGGGDIGGMFPDTDPAFDNISSGLLLAEVRERAARVNLTITHVDITVIAQAPRIAPHRAAIAANLAKLLQLSPGAVNVKATTEERLGFTGEKKGIKVMAVVTGLRPAAG